MKQYVLFIFLCILSAAAYSQLQYDSWEEESKTNKRLLPRYGHLKKTSREIESDSAYIKQILELPQFKTRREASDHMIGLGFQYYYKNDLKTAMYRFNQAYLLDSTNTDIFWGYGAIYMAFGQVELAKQQYQNGLAMNPKNTHLMTDLATYYLDQFYTILSMPKSHIVPDPKAAAKNSIDSAIHYLTKSYELDPKDINTTYKLSISYWNINDCVNAIKYYEETKSLGGTPTKEFTNDLKKRCKN